MAETIPTPRFGFDRFSPKTMLPGIFGHRKPKKQKMDKSITQAEFSEMYFQLRMSLLDQGASESEIENALRDLESRIKISDGPSGNRSTFDALRQRNQQIQGAGE